MDGDRIMVIRLNRLARQLRLALGNPLVLYHKWNKGLHIELERLSTFWEPCEAIVKKYYILEQGIEIAPSTLIAEIIEQQANRHVRIIGFRKINFRNAPWSTEDRGNLQEGLLEIEEATADVIDDLMLHLSKLYSKGKPLQRMPCFDEAAAAQPLYLQTRVQGSPIAGTEPTARPQPAERTQPVERSPPDNQAQSTRNTQSSHREHQAEAPRQPSTSASNLLDRSVLRNSQRHTREQGPATDRIDITFYPHNGRLATDVPSWGWSRFWIQNRS